MRPLAKCKMRSFSGKKIAKLFCDSFATIFREKARKIPNCDLDTPTPPSSISCNKSGRLEHTSRVYIPASMVYSTRILGGCCPLPLPATATDHGSRIAAISPHPLWSQTKERLGVKIFWTDCVGECRWVKGGAISNTTNYILPFPLCTLLLTFNLPLCDLKQKKGLVFAIVLASVGG